MSDMSARPAAMAATGIESNIEQSAEEKEPYCAITRFIPDLRWGLVARADRTFIMAGLRGTVTKLLVMDLAILLIGALLIWQWRSSYSRGIAKHEIRVTHRHAERVQAIFDTAFDAIVTFDRAGRVRTVNRAGEDLFGRSGGYAGILNKNTVGMPCPVCGSIIQKAAYLGGAVYWCPTCQPEA
jgi:PAS domain-containing protein